MNVLVLAASNVGTKTKTAMSYIHKTLEEKHSEHDITFIDFVDKKMEFADGRNYLEWTGDTLEVTAAVMNADVIYIGFPIFQASIPAVLKNLFDLLPVNALLDKTVGIVSTAGSEKHFLIAEMMLKPILNYMKAHVVQSTVFITEKAFSRGEIVEDDIIVRLENLTEQTLTIAKAHEQIRIEEESKYGF